MGRQPERRWSVASALAYPYATRFFGCILEALRIGFVASDNPEVQVPEEYSDDPVVTCEKCGLRSPT